MPEVIAKAVPDYTQFGRATKLRLNPSYVEDWTITEEFSKNSKEPAPELSVVQVHTPHARILSQDTSITECFDHKTRQILVLVHY